MEESGQPELNRRHQASQDFPDDAAAIAEAKEVAGDLRIGRVNLSQERIIVKNARRETIHEEPL